MAKPRVFLSSTYYDLKHVRERIERFLVNFGMEPVLFENDNVTFEFNKPLDLSAILINIYLLNGYRYKYSIKSHY